MLQRLRNPDLVSSPEYTFSYGLFESSGRRQNANLLKWTIQSAGFRWAETAGANRKADIPLYGHVACRSNRKLGAQLDDNGQHLVPMNGPAAFISTCSGWAAHGR
jgi:hypothetical protein